MFSDLNFNIHTYLLFAESRNLGSSWISGENRPEYWTTRWRYYYADGEPNFSGNCVYLSKSWYVVHSNLDIAKKSVRPFLFTISKVICLVNPENGSWVLFTISRNSLYGGSLYQGLSVLR